MDTPRTTETAHVRLTRMLGMGKYGEELALEILVQFLNEWLDSDEDLTPWLIAQGVVKRD